MARHIGIDLGTSFTRIFLPGRGIVMREPSAAAVDTENSELLTAGSEAAAMLGRTSESLEICYPIRDGVIARCDVACAMLQSFWENAAGKPIRRPDVSVAVPWGITEVERRAVEEVLYDAGAKNVTVLEKSLMAALGAGIRATQPRGCMIIDLGGGMTETAVMSLGGVVRASSVRAAGEQLNEAIAAHVRRKYNLMISSRTAEALKHNIGSVYPRLDRGAMEIRGRDVVSGLLKTVAVTSRDTFEAMSEPLLLMMESVRTTLENIPPEISADLLEDGILLTGGGSALGGITELLSEVTHLEVRQAAHPQDCVIAGIGKLLEFRGDPEKLLRFHAE